MCGIVGFITDEKAAGAYVRKKFLINALLADVVRGDDGTGIFMVKRDAAKDEKADWAKIGADAGAFIRSNVFTERLGQGKPADMYRAVIGHNRAATTGVVSTANSHPFQEGPITLVHNGTLTSMYGLPKGKSDLKDVDVDSHIITHNLATHTVEEVVAKLDGAYALVWHDARDQSVNIIRNDKRPLHLMKVACENTLLLASEATMLEWLVTRATDFKPGPIYYPEPGQWMKFTPEHGIKPVVKKLEMFVWKGYQGNTTSHRRWRGGQSYSGGYDGWDYDEDSGVYVGQQRGVPPWYNDRVAGTGVTVIGPKEERSMLPKEPASTEAAKMQEKLPATIKRTLKLVGLDPLDRLRFRVTRVAEVPGTVYANITGALVDLRRTGVIQGLRYDHTKDAESEMWTVLPVGVKHSGMVGVGELVLCRLLRRTSEFRNDPPPSSTSSSDGTDGTTSLLEQALDSMVEEDLSEEDDIPFDFTAWEYFDEKGYEITYETWCERVKHGCQICSEPIRPDTEFDWDDVTGQPICSDCVEEFETHTNRGTN
jgi:hypothetical protein